MKILNLDRTDLKFFAVSFGVALAVLVALFTTAYLVTPEGYVFCGILHDTHDGLGYLVLANGHAHQGLFVDNPWAENPQPGAYFNLIWYLMGLLMRIGIPFMPAYHVFRVVAGALMFFSVLVLMKEFFRERIMAWCAYLLACFGGGFSWILMAFSMNFFEKIPTADIIHGDSFPFYCYITIPLLALSYFMLVISYFFMYRATVRNERKWTFYTAAVVLFMGFSHPYHFLTLFPVLSCWYLALSVKYGKKFLHHWWDIFILLLSALPGVLYFKFFLFTAPNWAHWADSNVTKTSGWLNVVLGFGILMILPLFSYRGFVPLKKFTDSYLLVAIWAPVNFAMHFSYPFTFFDSRLGEGLIFPLAILSTWAFFGTVLPMIRKDSGDPGIEVDIVAEPGKVSPPGALSAGRMAWVVGLVLLTVPSYGFLMANEIVEVRTGRAYYGLTLNTKMIIPKPEMEALRAFDKKVEGDYPLVLVGPDTGLILPGFAPVRTIVGHIRQTVNFGQKMNLVRTFYGPNADDAVRRQLLSRYNFKYLWWGIDEQRFGGRLPENVPYLAKVFDNNYVRIYRVNREAL